MENKSKGKAIERIDALLDEGSFVEIGQAVTARSSIGRNQDSIRWCCNRLWIDRRMSSLCIQSGCVCAWWFHWRNARQKNRKFV